MKTPTVEEALRQLDNNRDGIESYENAKLVLIAAIRAESRAKMLALVEKWKHIPKRHIPDGSLEVELCIRELKQLAKEKP